MGTLTLNVPSVLVGRYSEGIIVGLLYPWGHTGKAPPGSYQAFQGPAPPVDASQGTRAIHGNKAISTMPKSIRVFFIAKSPGELDGEPTINPVLREGIRESAGRHYFSLADSYNKHTVMSI